MKTKPYEVIYHGRFVSIFHSTLFFRLGISIETSTLIIGVYLGTLTFVFGKE